MHSRDNGYRHMWLLSGTGEGPEIAAAFISKGWKVSVSVVSRQASVAYLGIPLADIWVGSIKSVQEIQGILKQKTLLREPFDVVLDATHPFALKITEFLRIACGTFDQKLIRFERSLVSPVWANYLSNIKDLARFSLNGKRILLALGSRMINEAVLSVRESGGIPFARVLPTPAGLRAALGADLPKDSLAVIKPFQGDSSSIEIALCKRWSINSVICRQSGGITQYMWERICLETKMDLWLISRPKLQTGLIVFNTLDDLVKNI